MFFSKRCSSYVLHFMIKIQIIKCSRMDSMKFKSLCLTVSSMLFLSTNAIANYSPDELVVKMKANQQLPNISNEVKVQNLFGDVYILRGKNASQLKSQFEKLNNVEYVEHNAISERKSLPKPQALNPKDLKNFSATSFNDPKVKNIWSFNNASKNGVSVDAAYRVHGNSATETITVAIVDSGLDVNHEDIKDVVWVNKNEIPGNKIDDDQNGYIDDVNGINTLVRDSQGRATGNNMDTHSHGTHVAGTIGAKQNNQIGIAGIASNVKLMGIRTVPNNGDETDVNVAESFIYAAKNGAKLINCSFGKSSNEGKNLIPDTLKFIHEKYGVLVIAAAGNDSSDIDRRPTYPASHTNENLLIIASTESGGRLSSFSNFGAVSVDVAAPGSSIYSTTPSNSYSSMSGTSMASPTTTGVAAEVLSQYPNLSALQLKQVLINSVTKIDRFKGRMVAEGRIDLLKALDLARTIK